MTFEPDAAAERDAVVLAVLPHAARLGWNARLFTVAARELGKPVEVVEAIVPGGVAGLVRVVADWADGQMMDRVASEGQGLRTRERIALGIRARLEALQPYEDAVRALVGRSWLPGGAVTLAGSSARSADRLWIAAGDRSHDFNWYSKRGLLAGVMSAATLFWLADSSPDKAATAGFIERRIDTVLAIGGRVGRFFGKKAA